MRRANVLVYWVILGGNGKLFSKCNFILSLFCGEKRSKSRSRDYSPLDNPPTGGFRQKPTMFIPRKPYKSDRLLLRCAHVSNDEIAADAPHCSIWGSVLTLIFSGQSVDFNIFQTGNRTNFFAQLAYGKMTFSNFTFMPSKFYCNLSFAQSRH